MLVVEDDPLMRIHAADIIEDAGFEVVEASNADEAILLLASRHDIRIVFTDVQMSGSMDGLALARAIRQRWPPVELVVTSAYARVSDADLPSRGRFLGKPYNPWTLTKTLRELAPDYDK